MSDLKKRDQEYIVGTYKRFPLELHHGEKSICFDENEKSYIDFTSGIGVNSLGFCNEQWVEAVSAQAKQIQHISNLYYTKPCVDLAEKLCQITGYKKVFFANSGAEANEGSIKIARKYSFDKYGKDRNKIICLVNSFHGRTVTTLAATGQDVFHNYFFPFTDGFVHVEANDNKALEKAITDDVCAILYEPIQGEGGVNPLDQEYVKYMKELAEVNDILLICDEVQTGIGRTGKFLAGEHFGIKADVVSLAKGLGGGLPIGGILCNEKTEAVLGYSAHGTTFGGNPIACAGAVVCVDTISNPDFLMQVQKKGQLIQEKLSCLDEVVDIVGLGLMLGIRLKNKNAVDVVTECMEKGLLVLTAKDKVRLLPPLTISEEELNKGLNILVEVLQS